MSSIDYESFALEPEVNEQPAEKGELQLQPQYDESLSGCLH